MSNSQTLPPPQGPEYVRCSACGHIEPEHRPDAGPCLVCDCAAYSIESRAAEPAVSVPPPAPRADDRAGLRQRIADELRAHASLGGVPPRYELPFFDGATPSLPRISGWRPLDDVADAVLAVLPEPTDQAAVLNRAADFFHGLSLTGTAVTAREVETELRRLADEAQQPEPEAEPTAEEIARANVLALHQIGEQLAGIETWMWEHLAYVPETAKAQPERPRCPHCGLPHDLSPSMELTCASIRASIADHHAAVSGPVAGEQQNETPEAEAHPPHHRWMVETRDDLAEEWAPGMRFTDRAEAVARYQTVSELYPEWRDGTPVQRRFVRETTSYTVEAPE